MAITVSGVSDVQQAAQPEPPPQPAKPPAKPVAAPQDTVNISAAGNAANQAQTAQTAQTTQANAKPYGDIDHDRDLR